MGVIPFRYRAATRVIATISPTRDAILTSDATVPSIETVQQLYPKQFADGLDHSRLAGREHCRYTAFRCGKPCTGRALGLRVGDDPIHRRIASDGVAVHSQWAA